ncbi:MAG: hypothetical protein QOH97_5365 [Actinoplanes sp.]|nr:hypothetical protein [Actinoplanes sp.]
MRLRKALLTLAAVPLGLGGCGALGLGAPTADASVSASVSPGPTGTPWIYYAAGSTAPSPGVSNRSVPPSSTPTLAYLPLDPNCSQTYTRIDQTLIPMTVTPGRRSLTVAWPRQYNSDYRITAVRQPLVSGSQPPYTWQYVATGTGCAVTAKISGLASGVPYIVWLDAPNTGYEADGTRHLHSGRSLVVFPR